MFWNAALTKLNAMINTAPLKQGPPQRHQDTKGYKGGSFAASPLQKRSNFLRVLRGFVVDNFFSGYS